MRVQPVFHEMQEVDKHSINNINTKEGPWIQISFVQIGRHSADVSFSKTRTSQKTHLL